MKRMKKFFALFLATVMCVGLLTVDGFAAETEESSTLNYLALGDSITTGHALSDPDTQGFVPLFGEAVGATTVTNMGVGGQTAVGLLSAINSSSSYQEAIAEADVITITIGGNDMLNECYEEMAEICTENSEYTITASQVKSAISYPAGNYDLLALLYSIMTETDYSYLLTDSDSEEPTAYEEAISTCIANINSITAKIKELNPDVTIMVANQYDAYYWLTGCDNLVAYFETGTQMYNAAFAENQSDDYTIADVYSAFAASETSLINAQLDTVNFTVVNLDFHPNAAGHKKIAETFAAVYESITSSDCTEHAWDTAPTWEWDGYSLATATFTCGNNPEHTMDVVAEGDSITYIVTKEATCSEDGIGIYTATVTVNGVEYTDSVEAAIPATGHSYGAEWESDENAHWHVCSDCGETADDQQHEYGEWVTTVEPTVDAAGTRVRTCTVCGYEESEEIEKLTEEVENETENETESPAQTQQEQISCQVQKIVQQICRLLTRLFR